MTGHAQLLAVLRDEIKSRGVMTFARFMELALYHPQFGYYTSGQVRVGKEGDYFTSPTVGPLFGRFLGMQFAEMWDVMGRPKPFVLLEIGANRGWLARDIQDWMRGQRPDFAQATEYWTCERGVKKANNGEERSFADWREIPDGAVTGCIFSNELVDALPVHLVRRDGPAWKEQCVDWAGDQPGWVTAVLTFPESELPAPLRHAAYPTGYTTEVHRASLDWLREMNRILARGFLVTIDYGYLEDTYYSESRTEGTLLCYRQHQTSRDPLDRMGEQDITAHVNFSALVSLGASLGLEMTGLTDQSRFLMGVGQAEIERIVNTNPGRPDRTRQQLQTLLHPGGMGRTFQLLAQQKGVAGASLSGWKYSRP